MAKISIVNEGFGLGGVERVATLLANGLESIGHNVHLIDFTSNGNTFYETKDSIEINALRKRKLHRKVRYKFEFWKYNRTGTPIESINLYKEQCLELINIINQNQYDFVILCQGTLTSLLPYIKRSIKSTKFVVWQHNEFNVYMDKYYKSVSDDYKMGLRMADLVVCLTKKDEMLFKKYNDNTTHIYNPLTIKTNEISNLHDKNIVFISRLSLKQKGLDYLVEVARNIRDGWKLHIAGDGPNRDWLEEQIIKHNLKNKVVIHGRMNPDEINKLYLSSSLFISTSRWEGFGLVLTEAMSVGLPIVSFKNQGPSEILVDGKYGVLIEKGNTRKFCEAINGLTSSHELRIKYQELSLKRVKDFDTKEITQHWDTQLKKLKGRID